MSKQPSTPHGESHTALVHEVCERMKFFESNAKCFLCAPVIDTPHGKGVPGCYAVANETVAIVLRNAAQQENKAGAVSSGAGFKASDSGAGLPATDSPSRGLPNEPAGAAPTSTVSETETIYTAAHLVPTSWLDPLLTGPDAVLKGNGPWPCQDIERLLNAIRKRIADAQTTPSAIRPSLAELREKISDAAYEWAQYVQEDNAPRNLVTHMEAAFDAATKDLK